MRGEYWSSQRKQNLQSRVQSAKQSKIQKKKKKIGNFCLENGGGELENLRKRNDQMLNNDNNKDNGRDDDDSIYDDKTAFYSMYPQMTRKCCLLNENNNHVLVFNDILTLAAVSLFPSKA